MARHVRNFWIEIDVDGRKQLVSCGPISAQGGFSMRIFQRADGAITQGATIVGHNLFNNRLRLVVNVDNNVLMKETQR